MRTILLILLFTVLNAFGQTENLSTAFKGKINDFELQGELSNLNGQLIGWYDYMGKSTKLRLEGNLSSANVVELIEYNYKAQQTGLFKGKIKGQLISGEWRNPTGSKKLPFTITLKQDIFLDPTIQTQAVNETNSAVVLKSDRKMFQPSKVKGFSKLALWVTIILIVTVITLMVLILKQRKKAPLEPKIIIEKQIEIHHVNDSVEDEISLSSKKGHIFEKHVVLKFNNKKDFFELLKDRSDKDYGGIHALENSNPDLEYLFKNDNKGIRRKIAVECKFRSGFDNGYSIYIDKIEKINNYKTFQRNHKVPVFLILGVGGLPDNPKETFVVPIDKINGESILREEIRIYTNKSNYFFYDPILNILK